MRDRAVLHSRTLLLHQLAHSDGLRAGGVARYTADLMGCRGRAPAPSWTRTHRSRACHAVAARLNSHRRFRTPAAIRAAAERADHGVACRAAQNSGQLRFMFGPDPAMPALLRTSARTLRACSFVIDATCSHRILCYDRDQCRRSPRTGGERPSRTTPAAARWGQRTRSSPYFVTGRVLAAARVFSIR